MRLQTMSIRLMMEEEQVHIEDLRPGDLVMPGLAHPAFDSERVYSVVTYRDGTLTLCSPKEEGDLRIDYQPQEYISRLPPTRRSARSARGSERTKGSPEQESIRQRWELRLLRDHGPEWLEQNRDRLDAEWEWILHMGL